jgi:hypothetical protein
MEKIGAGPNPFLLAVIPTVGFNLSTWSLPWVKILWTKLVVLDSERAQQVSGEYENGATDTDTETTRNDYRDGDGAKV